MPTGVPGRRGIASVSVAPATATVGTPSANQRVERRFVGRLSHGGRSRPRLVGAQPAIRLASDGVTQGLEADRVVPALDQLRAQRRAWPRAPPRSPRRAALRVGCMTAEGQALRAPALTVVDPSPICNDHRRVRVRNILIGLLAAVGFAAILRLTGGRDGDDARAPPAPAARTAAAAGRGAGRARRRRPSRARSACCRCSAR